MDHIPVTPLPLHTIRISYIELGNAVRVSLRTQVGDTARLNVSKQDCLRFLATTDQVRCTIDKKPVPAHSYITQIIM